MKKKIIILTCAYQRPAIFKIFLDNYAFLRKTLKNKVDLEMIVAGSEEDDTAWDEHCFEIVKNYEGVVWLEHPNAPVGKKWNYTLEAVSKMYFYALLILGSDDLLTPEFILKGISVLEEGYNFTGVKDMYVLNSEDGEMVFWEGYAAARKGVSIGAGRMLTKELVEVAKFKLWDDNLNTSLDGSTMKILNATGAVKEKVFECSEIDRILLIDVKSAVNIWKYEVWAGIPVDSSKMLPAFLPARVSKGLKKLIFVETK